MGFERGVEGGVECADAAAVFLGGVLRVGEFGGGAGNVVDELGEVALVAVVELLVDHLAHGLDMRRSDDGEDELDGGGEGLGDGEGVGCGGEVEGLDLVGELAGWVGEVLEGFGEDEGRGLHGLVPVWCVRGIVAGVW